MGNHTPFLFLAIVSCGVATAQPHCDSAAATELAETARRELQAHRHTLAVDLYERALENCPSEPRLLLELANSLFMSQRFGRARDAAERVLQQDRANAAALKIKANSSYLLREFPKAETTLLALLEKHPYDADAAYMLARMYYQEGMTEQAIGIFQRVLRIDPKSYKAHDNLGLCYQALGNNELAIRHFLTAIKLVETEHPDYDWVYANLAELLLKQGEQTDKAFSAAVKAAKRNPASARNFFLAGKALWQLDRGEEALKWLERAVELDSTYAEPLYLLGRIHTKAGAKDKADAYFERFRKAQAAQPRQKK
jgi:tetratricopeptide (TPR) repeat protein